MTPYPPWVMALSLLGIAIWAAGLIWLWPDFRRMYQHRQERKRFRR